MTAVLKKPFLDKISDVNLVEILISGCSDVEVSYDALINARWNGAMTANAISLISAGQTYNEFYKQYGNTGSTGCFSTLLAIIAMAAVVTILITVSL